MHEQEFDGFISLLKRLNGFFAVVHECANALYLATDHVRGFPLFYGMGKNAFFVSDDPFWVMKKTDGNDISELSTIEFLLTGFITGNESLCTRVKQVQSGEILHVSRVRKRLRVTKVRYYEFLYGNVLRESRDKLVNRLDTAVVSAIRRLIALAHGRTLVIPLGAGMDCRLIVLMLKRLGYDKVIALGYGRPGNSESEIAKNVASALGIGWVFVPYTNEAWGRWSRTEEWSNYCRMASGLASVPHVQDWPAIWELRKQRMVPSDSILVPGHLPVVWNPPVEWLEGRIVHETELLDSIIEKFYNLHNWSRSDEMLRPRLRKRIADLLKTSNTYKTENAFAAYVRWWWQEPEAKFVINSVRVYDFWGYEWWLPLWDKELARFWSRVPVVYSVDREIEKEYLKELQEELIGRTIEFRRSGSTMLRLASKLARKTHLYHQALRFYGLRQYDNHQFAWYGITPKAVFNRTFTGTENINSYVGMQTIQNIFPRWRNSLDIGWLMHVAQP
jgi:asparagine synthase (glutamine-hydrolysing)